MKTFLKLALFTAVVLGLSACNTIEGMGKDIGKAGSAFASHCRLMASLGNGHACCTQRLRIVGNSCSANFNCGAWAISPATNGLANCSG